MLQKIVGQCRVEVNYKDNNINSILGIISHLWWRLTYITHVFWISKVGTEEEGKGTTGDSNAEGTGTEESGEGTKGYFLYV